jgi:hypothetical protein
VASKVPGVHVPDRVAARHGTPLRRSIAELGGRSARVGVRDSAEIA